MFGMPAEEARVLNQISLFSRFSVVGVTPDFIDFYFFVEGKESSKVTVYPVENGADPYGFLLPSFRLSFSRGWILFAASRGESY